MRWPLLIILLLAFFVRLYHLTFPLGDIHSWRQADTAAVARSLYMYGPSFWLPICQTEHRHIGVQGEQCRIPLFNPQIDSYVTIDGKATWMDGRQHTNDTRNHYAEFPVYQALVAQGALILDAVPALQTGLVYLSNSVDTIFVYLDPPPHKTRLEEVNYQSNLTLSAPIDTVILSGRVISILSSLISIVFLYLLVRFYFKENVALLSAGIYGLLPYTVFWSRTVLPDTTMVMLVLGGLYFFHRWLYSEKHYFLILTTVFFAFALLMKLFVVFLIIPILFAAMVRFGSRMWSKKSIFIAAIFTLLPFLLWRIWIQSDLLRLPGIPSSDWLFNGTGVRLKPAWWYWLFQTRLDQFMFNFPGLGFIMIGLLFYTSVSTVLSATAVRELSGLSTTIFGKLGKNVEGIPFLGKLLSRMFTSWQSDATLALYFWPLTILSCFLFIVVFATGNVQHEYYQLPLVPFLSVFVSLGFWYIWSLGDWHRAFVQRVSALALVGLILLFGSHKIKDWYGQRMPSYVYAGMRADIATPTDATVVADFGGDTTMLYYANRPGWSIVEFDFDQLIRKGATHYVSAFRSDGVNELARTYKVVEESPEYVILDLRDKVELE